MLGIWGHLGTSENSWEIPSKKKATQNTRRITASTCGSSGVSLVVRRMASAGAGSKLTGMANSCGCNASPSHARKNGTLALETWHSQGRFMAKNAEFLSWKQPWNGGFIYIAILNAQQIQPAESRRTQPHQTDIPLSLAANCTQHPNRHFFFANITWSRSLCHPWLCWFPSSSGFPIGKIKKRSAKQIKR